MIDTLRDLKQDFTVGLISNGAGYPADRGLEDLFDFVVFADEYGVEKPDPRLFHFALESADVRAIELAHVGDSLVDDISGAHAAGCFGVWIDRENEIAVNTMPDAEIASLTDLRSAIDSLSSSQG